MRPPADQIPQESYILMRVGVILIPPPAEDFACRWRDIPLLQGGTKSCRPVGLFLDEKHK